METMVCSHCWSQIRKEATNCGHCGLPVSGQAKPKSARRRSQPAQRGSRREDPRTRRKQQRQNTGETDSLNVPAPITMSMAPSTFVEAPDLDLSNRRSRGSSVARPSDLSPSLSLSRSAADGIISYQGEGLGIFQVLLPSGEKRTLPLSATRKLNEALTALCNKVGLVLQGMIVKDADGQIIDLSANLSMHSVPGHYVVLEYPKRGWNLRTSRSKDRKKIKHELTKEGTKSGRIVVNLPKSPPLIVDTTGYDDIRRIIETIAVDQRLPSSGVIARDCFGNDLPDTTRPMNVPDSQVWMVLRSKTQMPILLPTMEQMVIPILPTKPIGAVCEKVGLSKSEVRVKSDLGKEVDLNYPMGIYEGDYLVVKKKKRGLMLSSGKHKIRSKK